MVQIRHRGLERALQGMLVVFEQPQDQTPDERREDRERVGARARDVALLDAKLEQTVEYSRQQVQIDLSAKF